MHDKVPLRALLLSLAASPFFIDVCARLSSLALDGIRVPFSRDAAAVPGFHGHHAAGIHSLLDRQPGPLPHFFAAQVLDFPRDLHRHTASPDLRAAVSAVASVVAAGRQVAA